MTAKALIKRLLQYVILSGPVYANLRAAARRRQETRVADARERIARIEPRPEHMRAVATPMPEPTLDLSVIVPVYNVERYVGACLGSVLSQDIGGRTFEVIAVDDGSTDASGDLVDRVAEKDDHLRVIHQENGGLSCARNTGISAARGRYLACVDSDDMLAPGHLRALLERMDAEPSDVVSSLWQRMAEDGTPLGLGEPRRTFMAPWGRLYRRAVWERLRFPVGCWYEDLVTPCCVQPLFSESFVDNVGYLYRYRPGSIVFSSTRNPKALDSFWVTEELLRWRHDLGITLCQADLDRLLSLLGPTLMGRAIILDTSEMRALFSLCCDLFTSLTELADVHASRGPAWGDIELALRTRRFELWCLGCAATATESGDMNVVKALLYFHRAMGRR